MPSWTFITNHGAVLTLIAEREQVTARAIADNLNITERSVHRIITDLENEGYTIAETARSEWMDPNYENSKWSQKVM